MKVDSVISVVASRMLFGLSPADHVGPQGGFPKYVAAGVQRG